MSRPRAKRLLGITIPQWGVLGVLVLCICVTLTGGYWWWNSLVAASYEMPPVIETTPLATNTPAPTETPVPTPTSTPILYESLIPEGWEQFTSKDAPGMEVWFPPSYEAWSESLNLKHVNVYSSQGLYDVIPVLDLVDMTQSPFLLYTTSGLSYQRMPTADLDKTVELVFDGLIRAGHMMEHDELTVGDYPARRLVFDITGNGVNAGAVVYVIQVNTNVWYLGFTTPYNELYVRMPDFDRVAQTFRILKP